MMWGAEQALKTRVKNGVKDPQIEVKDHLSLMIWALISLFDKIIICFKHLFYEKH